MPKTNQERILLFDRVMEATLVKVIYVLGLEGWVDGGGGWVELKEGGASGKLVIDVSPLEAQGHLMEVQSQAQCLIPEW